MGVVVKANNTILIVANINLIDAQKHLISDNVDHVSKFLSNACKVILIVHVTSDKEENDMRDLFTAALPTLPSKNIIFFESIQSIYSICRQIEPNYVVDAYDESYKLTAQFFKGRYFKTDASNFKATLTV